MGTLQAGVGEVTSELLSRFSEEGEVPEGGHSRWGDWHEKGMKKHNVLGDLQVVLNGQ